MAIVVFSVHHEDNTYSAMAVIKDDGSVVSDNERLTAVLNRAGTSEKIEALFNNGQSKVTGRFPEAKALALLAQAKSGGSEDGG